MQLPVQPERIVLRPAEADDAFTIRVEGGTYGNLYRLLGAKPVRWVQQTDFQNDEAVGFLADRLEKLGVEDALLRAGATPAPRSSSARVMAWCSTGNRHCRRLPSS